MKKQWPWIVAGALILLTMAPSAASTANRIANAIATAEGYFMNGSRAQRNNNPGNLTSSLGFPIVGYDDIFVIFKTAGDGWSALLKQVQMMLDGSSDIYSPSMSIAEVAANYTTTEQTAWAENVAAYLGVSVSTPIGSV